MEPGPLAGASTTRTPAQDDIHGLRVLAHEGQSAGDSDSASACESSGCDHSPSSTPQGRRSSLGDVPRQRQESLAQQRALKIDLKRGPSLSATSTTTGSACLAPRRLRSKAPPRVAWVSGKFIRELGSDDHRALQLPRCASFVYSLCHVEGYDIRAIHRDALQKHVKCRMMNEECSTLMLEVDDSLHLADPKARSQEAFEATCGLHGGMSGGSQLEAADGVRSYASAVVIADEGNSSAEGLLSPSTNSPHEQAHPCGLSHEDTSSEIDTVAAGGARSLRRGMRALASGRYRYDAASVTVAFVFERGPVILWIAASDFRARESRGRRELLSGFLFYLSQFATRFVRADTVQEDVMRFAYIRQVRKLYPSYEVPKSRIVQDCIYLKTESVAEKLAASFALAQSIRLSVYESLINFTIARVRAIPERMARFGLAEETVSSSSSSVWESIRSWLRRSPARAFSPAAVVQQPLAWSRLCGDLLGKIVDVNIVQDFRDVPEYFWNDDTWQHFWRRLYGHLEIEKRINLLNNRYFCIHELLKVIREERRSRQEFRLTWIVVMLLFFQVVAVLVRNFVIDPYGLGGH